MELCLKATKSAARPEFCRLSARLLAQQRQIASYRSLYSLKQAVHPPCGRPLPGLYHSPRLSFSMSAAGTPVLSS